jgi:hypothetical protein
MIEDRVFRKNPGAPDFLWNSSAFSAALLTQTPFLSSLTQREQASGRENTRSSGDGTDEVAV